MSHYFTNENIESDEQEIIAIIRNQKLKFITDNGVFSKKGLDFGTRTLLESIDLNTIKGKVLDFGCGYGPIGIFLKKMTDADIDMVDVNKRAINLAMKNAKLNNVKVNVFESDIYQNVKDSYDFIITNPPIRVGKKILYEILFDAQKYLNDEGQLMLVVNKNQGAKTLLKDLSEVYDAKVIAKNKGFYIIVAQKRWLLIKKPL